MSEEDKKRQLYNRQEYVVGAETQRKYGSSDILVVGLTGTGCEVVKNLMLTGVRSVTLVDDSPVLWSDLSSCFYAREEDVGKPRSNSMEHRLAELNRYVTLRCHHGPVDEALLKAHHVVIYIDHPTTLLQDVEALAIKHGTKFVSCESRGLAISLFVDGGKGFTIHDPNGEETVSCVLTGISVDGVISCHDDKKHECCEGDLVYFTHAENHPMLNSPNPQAPKLFRVTKVIGPFILQIEAPSDLASAVGAKCTGYLNTTKQPTTVNFLPLAEAIANPSFAMIDDDESKFTAPSMLHGLFQKVHRAELELGRKLGVADTAIFDKLTAELSAEFSDTKPEVIQQLLYTSPGNLNTMACILGGLATQEVLKLTSGKFTPVQQWLYYDARELLAQGLRPVEDRLPVGSRYDGNIAVFGKEFQHLLWKTNSFIVGAGALGCEFVKNYACLGISCGTGRTHITDMDRIELTNLSRQFLFRNHHIGQPKSRVAAEAAQAINPRFNISAKEEKVASETEAIFNEDFWEGLDFVTGALDNVIARKYVDSRCVFFKKALFESGTLGAKCSTQPVIPYLTESYGSTYDPPEKSIPLCTLKNFPNAIEHTIQWARDMFEKFFVNLPNDVNGYLHDPNFMSNLDNEPGNKPTVFASLVQGIKHAPKSAADAVSWARVQFEELFANNVRQLLHNLPLDKVGEDGQPFWSGAKKPPKPIDFDPSNSWHFSFVKSAATLFAGMYGIPFSLADSDIVAICARTTVPRFVPAVVSFAVSEKDKTQQEGTAPLTAADLPKREDYFSLRLATTEFEKDDDSNGHLDFVTAVSNLRAMNYSIPTEDKTRTKLIAGKIIPAMVTTTALVTGFVGNELLKYLLGVRKLDLYKSAFVNIALPLISFSNPVEPKTSTLTKADGTQLKWSMWDRFDVDLGNDVTLKELIQHIAEKHQIEPSMMSTVDGKLVYSSFGTKPARLNKKVSEVVEEVSKATLSDQIRYICFVLTPEEDVEVPMVRYKFRW